MSGIIFSACSTSWVFRCSLAAISVQFSTLKPCRRGKCKKKAWRRRTWCCEIEMNDEFSVEDCRSVSNSTGFECISQPGWRSKHSVRIQTVLVRGDPLREVLNENTAWSSQLRHSDANTNTSTRRDVAEPTKKPIGTQKSHHNFEISREQYWPSWESLFKCTMENWVVHKEDDYAWHRRQRDVVGSFLCQRLWKRQNTLDKIPKRICAQQRIRTSTMSSNCWVFHRNWSWIKKRISTIEWNTFQWAKTTLLHDGAVKLSNAKVHVYSDSVLCLGKKNMNILNQ